MARTPRIVLPGYPHHITQRGAHRQKVFFTEEDCTSYLDMLDHYCRRSGVQTIGYCLMDKHVHHLMIPPEEESLKQVFQPLHRRYAFNIDKRHGWTGHLWQERFYSCPMDYGSLTEVARYIDCNPVRAGMVSDPVSYEWSSARAHCGLTFDPRLELTNLAMEQMAC